MRPEFAHLFTRPFWLDEWHTALVANRATLPELFSDQFRGSDLGPPLLHLVAWTLARLTGGHVQPIAGRLVAFFSVVVMLVFVFLMMRRQFGRVASVAGALAIASHTYVVFHAFEFRYYNLWLAFAAAVAWTLGADRQHDRSRRRDVALAVLAVLLCLTHWLAVASLVLMCAGAVATFGRAWRAGLRRVAPAAAGLVVVVLSTPLVFAQRNAVVERSWMPDPTFSDVLNVLDTYWAGVVLVMAVVIILASFLVPALKTPARNLAVTAVRDPSIGASLALLVMPLAMVAASVVFTTMHNRYSIVTVLAWAPLVAGAVAVLGQPMANLALRVALQTARAVVIFVVLFLIWARTINAAVSASHQAISIDASRKALAQACRQELPIVFQTRHVMYPTTNGPYGGPGSCETHYLALSNTTLDRMYRPGTNPPRFFRFENEIARLHERLYDYPRVWTQAHVDSLPRFLLFAWDDVLPGGYQSAEGFGKAVFPNHTVTRLTEGFALFERR